MPHRGILSFQPGPVQLLRQLLRGPWALRGRGCLLPVLMWSLLAPLRVPTVPVKNLTGSSPVNPALAGEDGAAAGAGSPRAGDQQPPWGRFWGASVSRGVADFPQCHLFPPRAGITGILMSAAGLPVCLTRPPKLVLHPPPVSKSEIQSIPGISHSCRKTTKKQAKKGKGDCPSCPSCFPCGPHLFCCPWQWVSPIL